MTTTIESTAIARGRPASGTISGKGSVAWDTPIPLRTWDRPGMAEAVASLDIAAVYKILQSQGVSQRRIAYLTGQAQSEISEIIAGRKVRNYDVLRRIITGLGVPKGLPALGNDDGTAPTAASAPTRRHDPLELAALEGGSTSTIEKSTIDTWVAPSAALGDQLATVPVPAPEVVTVSTVGAILALAPPSLSGSAPPIVTLWTGVHIRVLRWAKRQSLRGFAARLGVSDRMVSKWEAGGLVKQPRLINQRALDTYLAQSTAEDHSRFRGGMKAIRYAIAASQMPPSATSSGAGTRYEVQLPLVCDSLADATAIAAEVASILCSHPKVRTAAFAVAVKHDPALHRQARSEPDEGRSQ
jgi:transcriptional regulator with XRE-family HTH domain